MGPMLAIAAVSAGITLFGQRRARQDAKRAQGQQLAFDAKSAKLQAKSLLEEAVLQGKEIRREGKLLGKKQLALTAKAGAKIGTGTAADIQAQTKFLTEKDVTTVMESAQRKGKQLEATFGTENTQLLSGGRLTRFKKFESDKNRIAALQDQQNQSGLSQSGISELTALQDGLVSKNNFIKSKSKKQEPLLTGL